MRLFKKNKEGYTEVVGALIALLVVVGIGAIIFFQITDSIAPDASSSSDFNSSYDATTDMGETIFGLLPIIALVVVAAIIIGVVVGMGGSKRGM